MPEQQVNPFESPKAAETVVNKTTIKLGYNSVAAFFVGACLICALHSFVAFVITGAWFELFAFALNSFAVAINVNTLVQTHKELEIVLYESK
jgi:uncharacterized membrane protein